MEIPVAITGYDISLWIHITAVVVGLGSTFAEAILFPVTMSVDPRHLPVVYRVQLVLNRYFASPALLIILITGIYQVIDYDLDLGSFWISASFAIVILLGAIIGMYFIPTDRKLEAMVTEEIAAAGDGPVELSEEFQRMSRTEGFMGTATGLLIVAAIFLMVVKPGA
ncbi:MAG: DUF2269 family protein [Thermoleophilia bacterium]|nr:DUF2269 family protein [Thermoleophilia bacterium]